jgi:flagellar hook-associated protein 1 FlgK
MSLALSLQSALSSLQANQSALQVVSNNVANAQTDGYTRKIAQPESVTLNGMGAGVRMGDITRNVDRNLVAESHQALSSFAALNIQQSYYQRVQDFFGQPDSNISISARLSDLGAALQELAATPESSTLQTNAVDLAVRLTLQMNSMAEQVQKLRTEADSQIADKVLIANDQLEAIVQLNADISRALAMGRPTGDLEDQRDQAVKNLSQLIEVQTFTRSSGEIVVTTPDGRVLADSVAATLTHDAPSQLSASVSYPASIDGINLAGVDITSSIVGGEIAGLIEMRDSILPDLQEELDQLTALLRDEINLVHNAGTSVPAANSLTGSRSFADPTTDTISFTSDVRIGVVDAGGDFVAYYDLPAGAYTIDAIETAIDANLAGFATASTSAAGPLSIAADDAANGIALVDLGTNTVTHTDGATTYEGFSNYFGLNDLFVTPGIVAGDSIVGIANALEVRSDIVADEALLSRATLDSGTGASAPAVGDPGILLGDASGVQALADKFNESLGFPAAGGLAARSETLAGYATEIIATNSIAASQLESDIAFRASVHEQLTFRLQSDSGVNLDEELANMVIYQNAYSAAARVISTTQELFDVLTNMVR